MVSDVEAVRKSYLAERQIVTDLRALAEIAETVIDERYALLEPLVESVALPKEYAIHSQHEAVTLAHKVALRIENLIRNLCTHKILEACAITEDLPDMRSMYCLSNCMFSSEEDAQALQKALRLENPLESEDRQEEQGRFVAIPMTGKDPAGEMGYEFRRMNLESAKDIEAWAQKLSATDKAALCHLILLRFIANGFKNMAHTSLMGLIAPKGMSDFLPEMCRMVGFAAVDFEQLICSSTGMKSFELFQYIYEGLYVERKNLADIVDELLAKGQEKHE